MNTREIAEELRLSHWAGIMRERSESGLSVKAFCENAGFHQNIYFYWQRKLREAACERIIGNQSGAASTSLTQGGFTEVRISEQPVRPVLTETGRQGELRIEAAGARITADSAYPVSSLAALIKELAPPC